MLESVTWKLFPIPTKLVKAASENQFNEVVAEVAEMLGKLAPAHHSTSGGKTGDGGVGFTVMLTAVGIEWQEDVPW